MAITFLMDVHVPEAISDQLRRRGVDVVTAIEQGLNEATDDVLLDWCKSEHRVVFTQDIRFKALAESWQRHGKVFAGLAFGHQLHGTIGQYICT